MENKYRTLLPDSVAGLLQKLGAHLNFSTVQSLAIKVKWKRCVGMGRVVVTRLNCVAFASMRIQSTVLAFSLFSQTISANVFGNRQRLSSIPYYHTQSHSMLHNMQS